MHIWPTFYNVTLVIDDDWIPAPSEMKCFLNVLIVQLLTHGADSEFQLSTTLLLKQLKVAMQFRGITDSRNYAPKNSGAQFAF